MPAFSKGLETVLHSALELANVRKHEFATLEHLLLALTEDQDAKAVIDACNVDMKLLRDNLTGYIDNDLSGLVMDTDEDCKPTAGFQRVIQRVVIHVQSSGKEEANDRVTVLNAGNSDLFLADFIIFKHPLTVGLIISS